MVKNGELACHWLIQLQITTNNRGYTKHVGHQPAQKYCRSTEPIPTAWLVTGHGWCEQPGVQMLLTHSHIGGEYLMIVKNVRG